MYDVRSIPCPPLGRGLFSLAPLWGKKRESTPWGKIYILSLIVLVFVIVIVFVLVIVLAIFANVC